MRIAAIVRMMFVMALVFAGSASAQTYMATLQGSQEVPPNASPATGIGCFTYDPASGLLSFEIAYSGLTAAEVGAHIHGPAPVGANAGVQFGLPAGPLKIGSVGPLSAAQLADLNGGLYYVNIHTNNFPGGEIRGQIMMSQEPCTVAVEEQPWSLIKEFYKD